MKGVERAYKSSEIDCKPETANAVLTERLN